MTVLIAPMPIATAGTSDMPGRSAAATPAAAPMKIAGKIGPPRKLGEAERVGQALACDQSRSAPVDQVEAW